MTDNKKDKTEEKKEEKKGTESSFLGKDIGATFIGIAIFVIFIILIFRLLNRVTTEDEVEWTRLVYLLSGVEAILFSATGYFFGEKASRERAENAESSAEGAEEEKKEAVKEANNAKITENVAKEKVKILAASIDSLEKKQSRTAGFYATKGEGQVREQSSEDIKLLNNLAKNILKDL